MRDTENAAIVSRDAADHGLRIVRAAVVDEDDFVLNVEPGEDGGQPLVHDRNRLVILVTGDDRADTVRCVEAEFLTRTLVGASVWKRLIPGDGLGQALREGGLRAPSQTPPSLLWIGVPVCDIPVALRHRERRGLLDVEEL